MRIEDALDQLSRQIGVPLRLDAGRECRLVFDGTLPVDIEARENGTVFLHTAVGVLPGADREAIYETLLEANLFGRGTGRSVLAVDAAMREIVLHRVLDMGSVEYAAFTAALEDFVAHARAWIDRLAAMRAAPRPAGRTDDHLASFLRA